MATLKDIATLAVAAVDALNALEQALNKAKEEDGLTDLALPAPETIEKVVKYYPFSGRFPGGGDLKHEIVLAASHLTFPVWFRSFDPYDDDILMAADGLLPVEQGEEVVE